MRVRADVTGDKDVLRELVRFHKAGDRVKDVLGTVAAKIAQQAKTLTPVDEIDGGDLRDSVRATKPRATKAGAFTASVIAGGPRLEGLLSERGHKEPGLYAAVVHEDPTLTHATGQYKFIETPWLQEAPKVPDMILSELDKARG